jgi:hypothetical protein
MTTQAPVMLKHGNAYNIFILVLTIYALALTAVLLLPIDDATRAAVSLWDNAVCIIFLIDFAMNLYGSHPKRAYFIQQRGWLDLLGSIPSFGFIRFTALFRLARLSRLGRITKLLQGQAGKDLVLDVLKNRSQYAAFITILLAGIVRRRSPERSVVGAARSVGRRIARPVRVPIGLRAFRVDRRGHEADRPTSGAARAWGHAGAFWLPNQR